MPKFNTLFIFFLLCFLATFSFATDNFTTIDQEKEHQWVDSVFHALTLEQKLGQLFMVAAYSNRDEKHYKNIENLIHSYHIGGLIFFQGGPLRQAKLTNRYQKIAAVPLLIAMDAEWGLKMRLDSTISYPKQMTLGAITDDQYIYAMGAEIARQCKLLGVHINFAPVVDINSNPKNPVIGYRSFGENKKNVAAKGIAYMKGMQDHGVMATAKHFPGHGDTGSDSHHTLPVIRHSRERLDSIELYPFKELINNDLWGTMIAHIHIPAYDDTPNRATTLSENVVTGLLKKKLQFEGLIFTDALNMKGVSKFYKPGEVDLLALMAGNDVLLFPEDVPEAIQKIKQAIKSKKISMARIDTSVKKILTAKFRAGLHTYQPIFTDHLLKQLNAPSAKSLKRKLYEQAVTVVKNRQQLVPVHILDTNSFASLSVGADLNNTFQKTLSKYTSFAHFNIPKNNRDTSVYASLLEKLKNYNIVVVGIHGMNNSQRKKYGLNERDIAFLKKLKKHTHLIINVFGNPYSLKYFEKFDHLICAYQDEITVRKVVPQIIFGALKATGRLPVSSDKTIVEGMGVDTDQLKRLNYAFPEDVGVDSQVLDKIDLVAEEAIKDRAIPGCQVIVARKGAIIFERAYGYHTYDSLRLVTDETVYDIASITKVAATLQAIMFLEERGLLALDKKVSYYLPSLKNTNKKDLVIKDILIHQAGLIPYIPFWKETIDTSGLMPAFYSMHPTEEYSNQVSWGLYSINSLPDSIWHWTIQSKLREKKDKNKPYDYKYSDMGFYILQKIAEKLLNQPIELFLTQNFYEPLGLPAMTYLPLCKYPLDRIAPTEQDHYFRESLVYGMVHDQGAAMYGGVAGHAGIFSNAHDLAVLLQMNLQKGFYGNVRYLQPQTLSKFTKKQYKDNRRGLGWDKPAIGETSGPTSEFASPATYGHSGFTGTTAWVDPTFELVYVFLSNRIYPDADNRKLISKNIRTRIQDIIYQAMWNYKKYNP